MGNVLIFNSAIKSDQLAQATLTMLSGFFDWAGFTRSNSITHCDVFILVLPSVGYQGSSVLADGLFVLQQARLAGKGVFLFNYSAAHHPLLTSVLDSKVHGVSSFDPLVLADLRQHLNLPVFLLEPIILFAESPFKQVANSNKNTNLIGVQSSHLKSAIDSDSLSGVAHIELAPEKLSDAELAYTLCTCSGVIASDLRTLVACSLLKIPFFQVSSLSGVELGLSPRIALPVIDPEFAMSDVLSTFSQYEQAFERFFKWASDLKLNRPMLQRFISSTLAVQDLVITAPSSRLKTYVKFKNATAIRRLPPLTEILKLNPDLAGFVSQAQLILGEFCSVLHVGYKSRLENRTDTTCLTTQLNFARSYNSLTWLSDSYPSVFRQFAALELKSHFLNQYQFEEQVIKLRQKVIEELGDFALGYLRLVFGYIFKSAQSYRNAQLICDLFVSKRCKAEDVLIDRLYTQASEIEDLYASIDSLASTEYSNNQEIVRYLVQMLVRMDGPSESLFNLIDQAFKFPDLSSNLIFDCFCVFASTGKKDRLLNNVRLLNAEVITKIDRFSPLMSYELRELGILTAPAQPLTWLGKGLSQNLLKLKKLLSDTSLRVAVVGNSPCELGLGKGAEIDSHDVVIRFNHFDVTPPFDIDYGKKTTVVFSIYHEENSRQRACYVEPGGFWVYAALIQGYCSSDGDWTHCTSILEEGVINPTILDHQYRLEFTKRFGHLTSTGLYVTAWLKSLRGHLDRSSFYGFSFVDQVGVGQRAHYFDNEAASQAHDWNREAEYFEFIFNG